MITIQNVSLSFSDKPLFQNLSLKINKDDRFCLVGVNGAGKSTLLKLLAGLEQPDEGTITFKKGIKIGYLPQEKYFKGEENLFKEVRNSLSRIAEIEKREKEITDKLSKIPANDSRHEKLLKNLGELNHLKENVNYYSIDSEIKKMLLGLGFKESDFVRPVGQFSGGWSMRIELAKILLNDNDILLLDEPTNHLDIDSLNWFIQYLNNFKKALIIVSHDKEFILKTTNKTLEIFNGKVNFFNGRFDKYLHYKAERLKTLQAEKRKQEQFIKETQRFIEKFRYKATKAKQVQSRIKMLEKLELIEIENETEIIEINFPEPPKAPPILVQLKSIGKSFNNFRVFGNVTFNIERGDKIAFLGPNGAGKTTLTKIIARKLKADEGEVKYGNNVLISYYSQEVAENLNLNLTCLETLQGINAEATERQIRTILGAFLFKGDDVFKKVKVLSGGEKSRLALAKILLERSNLLTLDEPTNHLDFNSKEALKRALQNYMGSIVLVSHDIDFIRGLADRVVDVRNNSAKYYYGDVDYYFSKRREFHDLIMKDSKKENVNDRKILKRIEAERRQQKYRATKGLKEKIEILEKQIEEDERIKTQLEKELASPEIFSNPQKAKEKNIEYAKVKESLENRINEWAQLTEELENIESQFN